ncbi:MAG TPA: TlpA disulfide reductase family protein, partial [Pseudosphingobacterium sp.]|nr:TlpA disulfide reductase family protein [Pseudosphingobacterium sp.]
MIFSVTAIAQETDTSKIKKASAGQPYIQEQVNKLYSEKDGKKAEILAAEIVRNIDTSPLWKGEKAKRDIYRVTPLYAYLDAEDFKGFKSLLGRLDNVTGTERIHFATAGYVRRVVAKGIDLDFAGQLIRKEREWARKKMLDALTSNTAPAKDDGRMFAYALFTMDYDKLLYRKGEKQMAFDLMKEAMEYNRSQRKSPDVTDYYLTVAAEFIPQEELKKEMETLIENEMSTAGMTTRLKAIYIKEKGSEAGFEAYISSFNKDNIKATMEALRMTMLNEAAPIFSLKDLKGNEVNLKTLKGKTIVLDFWATWCGPCIASFPAMQTMVNRYKDDPNVEFLFIDTMESGDNKEKEVKDFVAKNKYDFQFLMDSKNEVAKQYKVRGIPAKFVIDKNGTLRFRVTGFANDAALMNELEAMIKLAN